MGIMDKSDLLNELRIGKEQRDDHTGGGSRLPWIVAAAIAVAVAIGAASWYFVAGGAKAFEVEAATAAAPSAGGADTSMAPLGTIAPAWAMRP